MWWIPLITTAANMAYESFVAAPERGKESQAILDARQADYQKALADYTNFLNQPVTTYPQAAIDTAMAGVEETLAKQVAEVRPQLLTDLAVRGIKSSGISEYPLNQLEQKRLESLGEARRTYELTKLNADYQANLTRQNQKAQLLSALTGQAYAPYQEALSNVQAQPGQNAAIMEQLMSLGGQATAAALTPSKASDPVKALQVFSAGSTRTPTAPAGTDGAPTTAGTIPGVSYQDLINQLNLPAGAQ